MAIENGGLYLYHMDPHTEGRRAASASVIRSTSSSIGLVVLVFLNSPAVADRHTDRLRRQRVNK